MTKLQPIIAVQDVVQSSIWYQKVFEFQSGHGGDEFEMLMDGKDIVLCLHKFDIHQHPSMMQTGTDTSAGLILYFTTPSMPEIHERLRDMEHPEVSEIALSPNSQRREFTVRDLDGYYLIVSE